MTTTVIVQAHCASTKEVMVELTDTADSTGIPFEIFILQDGETAQRVVYDNRKITVREVPKESAETQ